MIELKRTLLCPTDKIQDTLSFVWDDKIELSSGLRQCQNWNFGFDLNQTKVRLEEDVDTGELRFNIDNDPKKWVTVHNVTLGQFVDIVHKFNRTYKTYYSFGYNICL